MCVFALRCGNPRVQVMSDVWQQFKQNMKRGRTHTLMNTSAYHTPISLTDWLTIQTCSTVSLRITGVHTHTHTHTHETQVVLRMIRGSSNLALG